MHQPVLSAHSSGTSEKNSKNDVMHATSRFQYNFNTITLVFSTTLWKMILIKYKLEIIIVQKINDIVINYIFISKHIFIYYV